MLRTVVPIGISDFRELIEYRDLHDRGYAFVDKTPLIEDVLSDGSQVIILPRPRRFGKTVNISMLQYFFASEVDGKSTAGLFDGLAIAQHAASMKYQGKHPVIFLTLKDAKYDHVEKLKNGLKIIFSNLYLPFKYLLSSDALEEEEKTIFKSITTRQADEVDLAQGLLYLSKFIFKHHGIKPYVLIDEYDIPIQEAYLKGYYTEAVGVIRNLFSAGLKDNKYLQKAVLTGIVRVSKESLFSGLNNVKIYSILSDKYSQHFGFLESEINGLLKQFDLNTKKEDIKQWYNGYTFGASNNIYNPWSILNCIVEQGLLDSYWINTSSNALVKKQIEQSDYTFKNKLNLLMQGKVIQEEITENFVFDDLGKGQITTWSLLVLTGYLKVVEAKISRTGYICQLAIPNVEVEGFYRTTVENWISQSLGMDWFKRLLADLTNARIQEFAAELNRFILESTSFFDSSRDRQESFYHGLTIGLVAGLKDQYIIKSNRESGLGRYDLALIPIDKNKLGIIMEFKKLSEHESLEDAANDALLQAKTKDYTSEMTQAQVNSVVIIGMAFSGKQVVVVSDTQQSLNSSN